MLPLTIPGGTTVAYISELPNKSIECPIFVTWEKRRTNLNGSSRPYELRGCIGSLSPKPLVSSVGDYALTSALGDRRFSPVTLSEVPRLRVSISLLVKYEECEDCYDWKVGVHGIMIKFKSETTGSLHSATFLPEVATQQGWDQQTTIESLVRKAGYRHAVSPELIRGIKCTRYQSSKLQASYQDYIAHHLGGEDPLAFDDILEQGQSNGGNCILM